MLCNRINASRKVALEIHKPKKIVNTLQQQYKNSIGMGFGDFLRGSFYLLEFCRSKNIEFDIDFSQHPIEQFLEKIPTEDSVDYKEVLYFGELDLVKLHKYINLNKNKVLHLFSGAKVAHTISENDQNFIRNKLVVVLLTRPSNPSIIFTELGPSFLYKLISSAVLPTRTKKPEFWPSKFNESLIKKISV